MPTSEISEGTVFAGDGEAMPKFKTGLVQMSQCTNDNNWFLITNGDEGYCKMKIYQSELPTRRSARIIFNTARGSAARALLISGSQIRAARAALSITSQTFAELARMPMHVLEKLERKRFIDSIDIELHEQLWEAFEALGIEAFVQEGRLGIRWKNKR